MSFSKEASELANHFGNGICEDEWADRLLFQWRNLIQSVKANESNAWKRELPEIEIFITSGSTVNAFATTYKGKHFITIFEGLINSVHGLFQTFLSDPRTFEAIGDVTLEMKKQPAEGLDPEAVQKRLVSGKHDLPTCPIRQAFATYMTELTLRFAFLHELAHISLGHADTLCLKAPLFEVRDGGTSGSISNVAMEFHADEIAFQSIFHWFVQSLSGKETTDPMFFYMNTLDSPLLDIFASTYSLFQLFKEGTSESHPSPVMRQARLGLMCHYLALSYSMQLRHDSATMVGTVMNNVDIYMNKVLGIDWSDRKEKTKDVLEDLSANVMPISDEVLKNHSHFEAKSYLDFPDFRCKVQFDDDISKIDVDEVVVLTSETNCWKCNGSCTVVAFLVTHNGTRGLLEYIEVLPQEILEHLEESHPHFTKVMVKEVDCECYSNHCEKCGTRIRDLNLLQPNGVVLTEDVDKLARMRKLTVPCKDGKALGCFGYGSIVDHVIRHSKTAESAL